MRKNCKHCSKEFYIRPSWHTQGKGIYCSRLCYAESKRLWISCVHCGVTFAPTRNRRKFCSRRCASHYGAAIRAPKPLQPCQECGEGFKALGTERKFCSIKCMSIAKRLSRGNCVICDKPFYKAEQPQTKTCSHACHMLLQRRNRKGEKSHLWQGGKTKRTGLIRASAQYSIWRKAVFERDDFTCLDCRQRGGKLAAHHKVPFSVAPELAFEISNGATLCWPCHGKVHTGKGKVLNRSQPSLALYPAI